MSMYALQYAVLGLVSAREDGVHGYRLKNEFDALYGEFWALNYGQMYRTLDRLERAGLIEGFDELQTRRPNRKVFRITRQGRKRLDAWLVTPASQEARPLRDEVSLKLLFLADGQLDEIRAVISTQRTLYLQHLARLAKRRSRADGDSREEFVMRLLLSQADMRVRTDLAWLDLVEAEVGKRFLASARQSPSSGKGP
jgi:DNA-binding PadR family transcriptional regulator